MNLKHLHAALKPSLALLCLLAVSCAAGTDPVKIDKHKAMEKIYYQQIEDWREKIANEGWSDSMVDKVVYGTRANCKYDWQARTVFKSPQQMIAGGFEGNCGDIASLIYGTLKRLGYPHEVRLQIVRVFWSHHMLAKVRMPSGSWKSYQTVESPFARLDEPFYTPVLEFNETGIWEY